MKACDHKFVDSTRCLKCGWSPAPEVHGGNYYGIRGADGPLERLDAAEVPRPPDVVICRRVADYPHGRLPAAAQVRPCARCQAPIAFNPAGPHQDRPKVCLQCARIAPLPIEPAH